MSDSVDIVQIQKMVFVFNAILAGWTVKMVDADTFEFKKNRREQAVNLDEYLRRFVLHNLNIDSISRDESSLPKVRKDDPNHS